LKLLVGFELIMVALTSAVVAMAFANAVPRQRRHQNRRSRGVATSLVVTALLTQFFGHVPLTAAPMLVAHPTAARDSEGAVLRPEDTADRVLAAVAAVPQAFRFDLDYVEIGRHHGYKAILPAAWFHALTDSYTWNTQVRIAPLGASMATPEEAAPVLARMLEEHPASVVRVEPGAAPALRALFGSDLGRRIVS
jgi:hypothetical protein